jgi:thiamine biosynthesis lipoprotein
LTLALDAHTGASLGDHTLYRTTALGCLAELLVTDRHRLVGAADILHQEVDRIDRAASRFRADSEIAAVGRARGLPVEVSECLLEAVAVALRVAEVTDGAVDPTVGQAMNALGYDRDFAAIAGGVGGSLPPAGPVPGWRRIELDEAVGTLRVPEGILVDLGATAKALTADRIARRVHQAFGCGVLVSLGGDVAMAGQAPAGGFLIGLADISGSPDALETVAIESGGLATSGVSSRSWRLGDRTVHHIVDPATGLPPEPNWRTVTVAAATCVDANAATTAAIVKGTAAVAWLAALGLPARLVAMDGHIVRTGGWPEGASSVAHPAAGPR